MFERAEVWWVGGAECLSVQLYSATPVSPHITTTRRDTDSLSSLALWPWPGNITTTLSQWTITITWYHISNFMHHVYKALIMNVWIMIKKILKGLPMNFLGYQLKVCTYISMYGVECLNLRAYRVNVYTMCTFILCIHICVDRNA